MLTGSDLLQGLVLDGGWRVVAPVPSSAIPSGGNFSRCYYVETEDGRKAFLKALDYSRALDSPDPARVLEALTKAFNFERDILARCKDKHLDRIVVAIADGTVRVPGGPPADVVQYLIFERADGDLRAQAAASDQFDLAFALRTLHQIAVGLWQLHGHGMVHQDLKPSNVLVFAKQGSKLADLGRAAYKGHEDLYDDLAVAGDPTYAPPELLYGQVSQDWDVRHLACDAYLMGSMITFVFTGEGTTPLLMAELEPRFGPSQWPATYGEALPYVQNAFSRVLNALSSVFPAGVSQYLTSSVSELCNPDPQLRGHPKTRVFDANKYSMERYISRFGLLARRAELRLIAQ